MGRDSPRGENRKSVMKKTSVLPANLLPKETDRELSRKRDSSGKESNLEKIQLFSHRQIRRIAPPGDYFSKPVIILDQFPLFYSIVIIITSH